MKGIKASPGITISKVLLIQEPTLKINKNNITESLVTQQINALKEGIQKTVVQLSKIRDHAAEKLGDQQAQIFDGHLMIVEDEDFHQEIIDIIKNELRSVDYAIDQVISQQANQLENLDDPYLAERAADIRDIGSRLLKNTLGLNIVDLSTIEQSCVIVIKDLTPSQTAVLPLEYIDGFATDLGGKTSHSSIIARSLEIPAIVGLGDITSQVTNGQVIILDAINNNIILDPTPEEIQAAQQEIEVQAALKAKLSLLKDLPAQTKDGARQVILAANIGSPKDLEGALENGASAIGLYRSEFLFMDRTSYPSEDDQFNSYKEVAEKMAGKEVILRSMDIGGDKELPYLNLPKEMNPFLGYRAIRIGFDQIEEFKQQIRAVLKASQYGNMALMFPMVISLSEIIRLKEIVAESIAELTQLNPQFSSNLKVGIMIETPAAAVCADIYAQHVDFLSIGTNDLTQYTLAVDRGNELIANLYNHFHPAVIRLVKQIIDAGHQNNIPVGICGELAGDVLAAPLLLAFGLDEFSMSAISIPKVKNYIRNINLADAEELAEKVLASGLVSEIEKLLQDFYDLHYQP